MNTLGKASYSKLRGYLKKTGQTTSYGSGSGVDDGGLQIGVPQSYTVLSSGQYSGTTNITLNGKTDAHSNNCVFDPVTRLMWSISPSASVGPSSNGTLPWTTNGSGEGIFTYVSAANAANLAGYNDWHIPNLLELLSIMNYEAPTAEPDSLYFTGFSSLQLNTATTQSSATTNVITVNTVSGICAGAAKTTALKTALVRGPL